ncbi:MAG: hypothetical protein WA771_05545 [Chthoniobacterales bacterium]
MTSRFIVPLTIFVSVCVALMAATFIATGDTFPLVIMSLVIICGCAIALPRTVTLLTIALFFSAFSLPQLQGKLNMFHLGATTLLALAILNFAMTQRVRLRWSGGHTAILLFIAVILLTMGVRGSGFRVLGSEKWGGMFYLQLVLCASLVYTVPQINLSSTWWRRCLILAALSTIPAAIAEILIYRGFGLGGIASFFQVGAPSDLDSITASRDFINRYFAVSLAGQSLYYAIFLLIPAAYLFSPPGLKHWPWAIGFTLTAAFGGFRTVLLSMVGVTVILMKWSRSVQPGFLLLIGCAAMAGYISLVFTADYLPVQWQRAVSFLPGLQVSEVASADASTTVVWRLELWRRALDQVPYFLFVGRGYAFSATEYLAAYDNRYGLFDALEWAIVTSAYHQGSLSLLVGLGVPGLITGYAILFLFARRHLRVREAAWSSPKLQTCHTVVCAIFLMDIIQFVFIYGDVQASFPAFFYRIAILEGLLYADESSSDATQTLFESTADSQYEPELMAADGMR